MWRITDTAKRTVRVRVMGTARRWRGRWTQSRNWAYGLSGQGRTVRAQRMVAGAEGGHGEMVEGRADRRVLQTQHPADTARDGASAGGEHGERVEGWVNGRILQT